MIASPSPSRLPGRRACRSGLQDGCAPVVAQLPGQRVDQRAALGAVGARRRYGGDRDRSLRRGALQDRGDDEDGNDGADGDDERGDQ